MDFWNTPSDACTYDRCFVSADCERICQNLQDFASQGFQSDVVALSECTHELSTCTADADCPGGLCLDETRPGGGSCSRGDFISICLDAADCSPGLYCVKIDFAPEGEGVHECHTGERDELCNTDEQCIYGRCVVRPVFEGDDGAPYPGRCSAGVPDDACGQDADCAQPATCLLPANSGQSLGDVTELGVCVSAM